MALNCATGSRRWPSKGSAPRVCGRMTSPSSRSSPPALAYKDAVKDKARNYLRLTQVANQLKGCLASGYPFVFGFTVYESFEGPDVAQTGVVPMLSLDEPVLGGHAVCAVGYDDAQQRFTIRNSWGARVGNARLLHHALYLPAGSQPGFRLLDHPHGLRKCFRATAARNQPSGPWTLALSWSERSPCRTTALQRVRRWEKMTTLLPTNHIS
jgi:hypothetical protein